MSDDTINPSTDPGQVLGNEPVATEEISAILEPRPSEERGSTENSSSNVAPDRGMSEIVPTPIPAPVPEPVTPPAQPVSAEPATPVLPESAPVAVPPPKSAKYFITMALEAIQFRKRKKLDKIMKFVTERGSIPAIWTSAGHKHNF